MQQRDLSSRPRHYSRLQITLHWAVALLVLSQLLVNDAIRLAFRLRLDAGDPASGVPTLSGGGLSLAASLHVAGGLLLLVLMASRLLLRLFRGTPPPPSGAPPPLSVVAEWAHRVLYLLLIAMALTGAWAWFGTNAVAARLHEVTRLALVAVIIAHILGALVEHYVVGNRVIRRMVPEEGSAGSEAKSDLEG